MKDVNSLVSTGKLNAGVSKFPVNSYEPIRKLLSTFLCFALRPLTMQTEKILFMFFTSTTESVYIWWHCECRRAAKIRTHDDVAEWARPWRRNYFGIVCCTWSFSPTQAFNSRCYSKLSLMKCSLSLPTIFCGHRFFNKYATHSWHQRRRLSCNYQSAT